jgi:APA family basic amino acid/polyamine antiporter
VLKVLLLIVLIVSAYRVVEPQDVSALPRPGDWGLVATPEFAVSLIYVSFAYTGWNAAIYIVGEMGSPSRDLPRALFIGTAIVLVLYTFVNFGFMYTVPVEELAGQIEVGYLSASRVFGAAGGSVMALTIALILTSTVSVMVYVGPRIIQVMGEDIGILRPLAYKNARGIPTYAVIVQSTITLVFIYIPTFQQVLLYAGFTLNLITALTVAGIFVLRRREPDIARPYRTWGYPWPPIIYLILSAWSLTFMLFTQPWESMAGLLTLMLGLVIYAVDRARTRWQQTGGSNP